MNRKKTPYYKFAKYLCEKYDEVESIKYVAYFFEMISFQIIETLIILYVCNMLGLIQYTIVTMIGFTLTRITKNGYHADSTIKCMIYSLLMFVVLSYVGSLLGLLACFALGAVGGVALRKNK